MFAVMKKDTKEFFGGWNGMDAIWVSEIGDAKPMSYRDAKGQALCFLAGDNVVNVQRKPVKIQ